MLHDRQAFLLVAFFSFVMSNGTRLVTSQIHRLHLCVCRLDLLPLSLSVCLYAVTLSSKLSPEPPRASSDELKGKLPRSSRVEPCCELLRPMSADSSVDLPLSARLMMSSVDLLRAKLPSLPSAGSSASRRGHRTPSREASS